MHADRVVKGVGRTISGLFYAEMSDSALQALATQPIVPQLLVAVLDGHDGGIET